jgi:hypothetical protein
MEKILGASRIGRQDVGDLVARAAEEGGRESGIE